MLNFKIFVPNGLAGPYREFLGMALKKFENLTWPNTHAQLCHPFMCALPCYFKVYYCNYSYAEILLITKPMGHVLKMCSVPVIYNDDKYARYFVTSRQY